MSDPLLNDAAKRENASSLAAALGLDVEHTAQLLNASILISPEEANPHAELLARQLKEILCRTFAVVSSDVTDDGVAAIEVIVGNTRSRSSGKKVWVCADADQAVIDRSAPEKLRVLPLHPALALVVACYTAGAVVATATDDVLRSVFPRPFLLDLRSLGSERELDGAIYLGRTYLAGAGAIGNGVLYALQYFDSYGQLDIADFDVVKHGNLNRQVWFTNEDLGKYKAEVLAAKAQEKFPHLVLVPRVSSLQELPEKKSDDRWLRRLIVAVDSRRARRSLQSELPGEVFDASTTDIREIVLHYNKLPTDKACMACIYDPDDAEEARTKHVAESLGVSVEDVRENVISPFAAKKIVEHNQHITLHEGDLIGEAYDSLFKSLCGQAALRTPEGRQVFAPFAFVSVLAGTLLVLDMVRRLKGELRPFNLWRVSPWFPFTTRLQRDVEAVVNCQVCAIAEIRGVADSLWR